MKKLRIIFFKKKILIYGLGKSGLSAFDFLKKKNELYLYDDNKIHLKNKKLIKRQSSDNNRSNKLILTEIGSNLVENLINQIDKEEKIFFEKLNQETFNFINSLKLLLGKKIRIKANYND